LLSKPALPTLEFNFVILRWVGSLPVDRLAAGNLSLVISNPKSTNYFGNLFSEPLV